MNLKDEFVAFVNVMHLLIYLLFFNVLSRRYNVEFLIKIVVVIMSNF